MKNILPGSKNPISKIFGIIAGNHIKLSQNITPFAGVSFINDEFNRSGLSQLIDTELGTRGNGAKYLYCVRSTRYSYRELLKTPSGA